MLQNITFSAESTEENFSKAATAAQFLSEQVADAAAKTGVPIAKLTDVLETFIENGGFRLIGDDPEKAVRTVSLLATALENAKVSSEQLAKFLSGTIEPSDKILQVLKLSAPAAHELVEQAERHGDLQKRLIRILPDLQKNLDNAAGRYKILNSLVDIQGKRLSGIVAGPLFAQWLDFLQEVIRLYEKGKFQIELMAKSFGTVAASVFETVKAVGKLTFELIGAEKGASACQSGSQHDHYSGFDSRPHSEAELQSY